MSMSALGPGPNPRKAHPLAMRRTLLGHKCSWGLKGATQSRWQHSRTSRRIGKVLKRQRTRKRLSLLQLKYYAPDRAMLFSFYNHPQPLWIWADGKSISPKKMNLHVDVHGREKTSIKGGGDKVQRPEPGRPCQGESLLG